MEDRRFIKPKEGLTVRDPFAGNRPLPPYGAGVPWSSWWERRLADLDIEMTTEAAVTAGEEAAEVARAAEQAEADRAERAVERKAAKPAKPATEQGDR